MGEGTSVGKKNHKRNPMTQDYRKQDRKHQDMGKKANDICRIIDQGVCAYCIGIKYRRKITGTDSFRRDFDSGKPSCL